MRVGRLPLRLALPGSAGLTADRGQAQQRRDRVLGPEVGGRPRNALSSTKNSVMITGSSPSRIGPV